ncbi:MAG: sigma-70 family RNA polymerase sigma factor [Myxococcales bacterium]|nr:MAG: sigma-70 family RNA polymerase sigma factor [Myxococcales bacterium]
MPQISVPAQPLVFEAVYRAWYGPVVRWARRLGANAGDCEDLAQEVFVIVKRRLPDFDGGNVAGWLYRITRNRVRDHRRSRWARAFINGLSPDSIEQEASSPLDSLEMKQRYALLERRWSKLNDAERRALSLLEVHGMSGEEIAATLDVPLNTVWSQVRRARLKLASRPPRPSIARASEAARSATVACM